MDVRRLGFCVWRLATLDAHQISPIALIISTLDQLPNAFFPLGRADKKWQKYPPFYYDRLNRSKTARLISTRSLIIRWYVRDSLPRGYAILV
jgi:hypothetical protein